MVCMCLCVGVHVGVHGVCMSMYVLNVYVCACICVCACVHLVWEFLQPSISTSSSASHILIPRLTATDLLSKICNLRISLRFVTMLFVHATITVAPVARTRGFWSTSWQNGEWVASQHKMRSTQCSPAFLMRSRRRLVISPRGMVVSIKVNIFSHWHTWVVVILEKLHLARIYKWRIKTCMHVLILHL